VSRAKTVVLALLSSWQWTRRFRQPACRFYPSCSQYAKQAIEKHGLVSGMRLGVVRICKCHPFHDGGVDEVPELLEAGRRMASPLRNALIVMKSGLNPVFLGMKVRIFAQAFCLKTPLAGNALSAKCSKTANNLFANTSRRA
jgi:putative membrane protein insertion efficiency factor